MNRLPLVLALIIAAPAAAQTAPDMAEIRSAAQAFEDAQLHGERAALERMVAQDFLLVRGSGRIGDKKEFINGYTDPAARLDRFDVTDRLLVRPSGDTAIVGGEAWVAGQDHGRPLKQHFRYSDVFAKRNGQWVVVYAQITPLALQ